jgi:cation diffusion facilitator CzcD-associated flavoprotein CzcO
MRATFNAVPLTARVCRDAIYLMMEARALGFAVHPKLMAPLERMGRRHLENQVADPALRARLTPDYTIGCKRILLSSTYGRCGRASPWSTGRAPAGPAAPPTG